MASHKSLKTLVLAMFTALLPWTLPAHAAGTLPLAMAQQIDINGKPLAGCQVTFFVAGTVATLQNNYADFGLTTAQANPLSCDQAGRVPMFWLADGLVHVRMTDSAGLPVIDLTMQVLGPSSGGGGGGGTVDPTTVLATGDEKLRYGTGPLPGFVRCNGLTIGSALSGATERSNADTQALFIYLYSADPNLAVSGGRSGNALNDFNANRTITLPDARARLIGALDGMGNGLSGRLSNTFGGSASVLGIAGGSEMATLTSPAQLPAGITSNGSASVTSVTADIVRYGGTFDAANVAGGAQSIFHTGGAINAAITSNGTASVTSNNTFGSPHPVPNPMMLATLYIKL